MDGRLVRRLERAEGAWLDPGAWPLTVPAVRQVWETGLELPAGVTVLVGENGSGKSTLVEALAVVLGLSVEGGSKDVRRSARSAEVTLGEALHAVRGIGGRSAWGWFLRAETMHGLATHLEELDPRRPSLHDASHGESFLQVLDSGFRGQGVYLLDEPESALSFRSCLRLLQVLDDVRSHGAQVVMATHSPVLAALPGATLLEVGAHGLREAAYDDLDLVQDWRGFLDAPQRWLHHVLEPD